jgi:hypothetical protein
MKLYPFIIAMAAANLCIAADPPKSPAPAPDIKSKEAEKPQPPILTLEGPKIPLVPGQSSTPATPTLPPELLLVPANPENTGPAITFNDKNAPLAPGIYTASPYTGIVVVPGPIVPDMTKNPGSTRDVMPQREPELKLTPRTK